MYVKNTEIINRLQNEMLDSVTCGVFAYTVPQFEIITMNEQARSIIGCGNDDSIETVIKNFYEKKIHPEDRTKVLHDNKDIEINGGEVVHEYRISDKKGIRYIYSVSRRLEFEDGQKYIISTFKDVTSKVKLMKSLKRERKSCREALIKNCEFGFFFDLTEGLVYEEFVTAHELSIARMLGLEVPVNFDVLTRKYVKAMNPVFVEKGMEKYLTQKGLIAAYEKGNTCVATEYYVPAEDKYIRTNAIISKDDETDHLQAFIIADDITELRRKEEEQRRSLINQNLQLISLTDEITDQLGSGILAYTLPDRHILVFNQEARKMFDAPEMQSRILSFDVTQRIIQEDKAIVSKAVRKLEKPGDSVEYSFHNLRKDGTVAVLKCTTKLLSFPDGGKYILSSIIDITKQRAFEKLLEEERQRYKTALSIGSVALFSLDLTEGKISEPLISKDGENITDKLGISIPAYYDDFARVIFSGSRIVADSEKIRMLRSRKSLISAYKEGTTVIDFDYCVRDSNRNAHLIVMLHKKDKNVIASFIFYDNK